MVVAFVQTAIRNGYKANYLTPFFTMYAVMMHDAFENVDIEVGLWWRMRHILNKQPNKSKYKELAISHSDDIASNQLIINTKSAEMRELVKKAHESSTFLKHISTEQKLPQFPNISYYYSRLREEFSVEGIEILRYRNNFKKDYYELLPSALALLEQSTERRKSIVLDDVNRELITLDTIIETLLVSQGKIMEHLDFGKGFLELYIEKRDEWTYILMQYINYPKQWPLLTDEEISYITGKSVGQIIQSRY